MKKEVQIVIHSSEKRMSVISQDPADHQISALKMKASTGRNDPRKRHRML